LPSSLLLILLFFFLHPPSGFEESMKYKKLTKAQRSGTWLRLSLGGREGGREGGRQGGKKRPRIRVWVSVCVWEEDGECKE
jgi:hypothetical protein